MNKKKKIIRVMDIRYDNSYNPEKMKGKNRDYRFIIDGDGKEKIVVEEEIDTDEENEE